MLPPPTSGTNFGTRLAVYLSNDLRVTWCPVVDGDPYGTRHYGQDDSNKDPSVGNCTLQTREPLAVQVQEKRHCTQGQKCGACGHHNTVKEGFVGHFSHYCACAKITTETRG